MAPNSSRAGRVTKRAIQSTTSRSPSNKASSSKGKAVLQKMVDEATISTAGSSRQPHGAHVYDIEMPDSSQESVEDTWQSRGSNKGQCPILDGDSKPFNLMLLPAEIRNEIYRACLTRPYNVLLSKREPLPAPKSSWAEDEEGGLASDAEGSETDDVEVPGASVSRAFSPPLTLAPNIASLQASAGSAQAQTIVPQLWTSRAGRLSRFLTSSYHFAGPESTRRGAQSSSSSSTGAASRAVAARSVRVMQRKTETPKKPRPQDADPLLINILRCNKQIYQEARAILYSENCFTLDLDNALPTLAALHQRSRRQIKHVEVEIPSYNEILERFQETVRLSLRYCWGLRKFVIHMPFTLPGADGSGTTGNTTVYANGFDILRWLPKQCEVVLQGIVASEIEAVVAKNANLAKTLDELAYARRQLISNEEPASSQQETTS
ncbi:hypothetical protein EJ03DRAFT_330619 [Teratosphaeria nubilosa]|uniref:Uncharacterized protein n=1 Tax=Teratosphaeria nubilosa TaxID=161662 RepID=A0A6G1KZ09_9PEZI|nr:hypothetical protein EJ03DRAFT_330619 [Teratosphaeria nubilosa]